MFPCITAVLYVYVRVPVIFHEELNMDFPAFVPSHLTIEFCKIYTAQQLRHENTFLLFVFMPHTLLFWGLRLY